MLRMAGYDVYIIAIEMCKHVTDNPGNTFKESYIDKNLSHKHVQE